LAGGFDPLPPATAIAVPPPTTATTLASSAARRGMEIVRRKCIHKGW
jgi:hypothetical protein